MLEAASGKGVRISRRLMTDWIGHGLLASPSAPGKGRASGRAQGTWPRPQLELFAALATLRAEGLGVQALCPLPVWYWLTRGDDWVPLSQARRAFKTWAPGFNIITERQSQAVASRVLAEFDSPTATRADRKAFRTIISEAAYRGIAPDNAKLADAIAKLGRSGGDFNAESYATLITIQLRVLRDVTEFTDAEYKLARALHNTLRADFQRVRPDDERPTDDRDWPNACAGLVACLGHGTRPSHQLGAD